MRPCEVRLEIHKVQDCDKISVTINGRPLDGRQGSSTYFCFNFDYF